MIRFGRTIARRWWAARSAGLLLAFGELLLAALAAAPGAATLAAAARQTTLRTLAGGDWFGLLADLPGAVAAGDGAGERWTLALLGSLLAGGAALLLHAALYTFVVGAALERMAGRPARLWAAGARWFWPMARLGAIVVLGTLLLAAGVLLLLGTTPVGTAHPAVWLLGALLLFGALGSFFELARVQLVARPDAPSVRLALRQAVGRLGRRLVPALGLWLALGLGNLGLAALVLALTRATSASDPVAAWALAALTIAAGVGYKLFRLAAQFSLVPHLLIPSPPPGAEGGA